MTKSAKINEDIDENLLEPTFIDELDEDDIRQVMNPERLAQLLAQADVFGVINSENLDDFD